MVESGDRLSANEIKAVTKSIGERLKYLTFSYYIEIMRDLIMRYDTSRYDSLGDLNDEFKEYVISCLNDVRKAESNISQNEFSLKSDIMEAFIKKGFIDTFKYKGFGIYNELEYNYYKK